MSTPKLDNDKQNPFIPEKPEINLVRRLRTRWIIDIIFASIMFGFAVLAVRENPSITYFLLSAFWFILAGWDRHKLNRAMKEQSAV